MPIKNTLPKAEKMEIQDHLENTAKEFIKTYTLSQLSYMEWVDTRTIKKSWRFLPVRVDTSDTAYRCSKWRVKKPYMVRYVRLDEIKAIFNSRTGKKLTIDL